MFRDNAAACYGDVLASQPARLLAFPPAAAVQSSAKVNVNVTIVDGLNQIVSGCSSNSRSS
jgi:hypothetical protein